MSKQLAALEMSTVPSILNADCAKPPSVWIFVQLECMLPTSVNRIGGSLSAVKAS